MQLLRQHSDLASLIANEFVYRGISNSIAHMRILLPKIFDIVPGPMIIIDGLDECSSETQKSILKEVQWLCSAQMSHCHCKALISSRKEVFIHTKLTGRPHIQLDVRREVDLDIRSFIRFSIQGLRSAGKELLERVESVLVEKSHGAYLKQFIWQLLGLINHQECFCG